MPTDLICKYFKKWGRHKEKHDILKKKMSEKMGEVKCGVWMDGLIWIE
jgi:hypothetical protein